MGNFAKGGFSFGAKKLEEERSVCCCGLVKEIFLVWGFWSVVVKRKTMVLSSVSTVWEGYESEKELRIWVGGKQKSTGCLLVFANYAPFSMLSVNY